MDYLITTTINSQDYCVKTNVEDKRFELMPIFYPSDVSKAFNAPFKSIALNILSWIKTNDEELSKLEYTIQPATRWL